MGLTRCCPCWTVEELQGLASARIGFKPQHHSKTAGHQSHSRPDHLFDLMLWCCFLLTTFNFVIFVNNKLINNKFKRINSLLTYLQINDITDLMFQTQEALTSPVHSRVGRGIHVPVLQSPAPPAQDVSRHYDTAPPTLTQSL